MFRKVLVANRGEIALRVMRTLREMGIATVAIHSEPDTSALHVREADEARCLGGAEPSENYLDVDGIVAAARDTGAEAVHPGYGFLSENPALARALEAAGVIFIGPPAVVLERVGDKTEARRLMRQAGVPVVPGMDEPSADPTVLAEAAAELGFPVLVKAAAGGGGKGMRLVESPDELAGALREAVSEARAAFGDGAVYLERALERPRHVEIQILADAHGQVVHLLDRECSLQRRHQKIIEECPCPALDEELRAQMGRAAVEAARAAGYVNAGTVEFLLDTDGAFYFLEVNARLQVEHPVTELVTGLDLVRRQLEIAAGAELGLTQQDVVGRGHAIECRIYAEDPAVGFAPSPGRIELLRPPQGPGVRFDGGVETGSEVLRFYDPIVAKLITWGEDREAARTRMVRALEDTVILGVETPVELLLELIQSEAFRRGETHTGLVAELLGGWSPSAEADELALIGAALAGVFGAPEREGAAAKGAAGWPTPWETLGVWGDGRR